MRTAAIALGAWLLQASVAANDPTVEVRHMRYERALALPAQASGQACAALDASVFAHAANESLNDLRLSALGAQPVFVETPFVLTQSGTERSDDEPGVVRNLGLQGSDIVFDIAMPNRPYTAVVLDLDAKDFVGTAHVTGSRGEGAATDLGTFAIFDLSSQHLSRSTTVALQESTFAVLHVVLHLAAAPGAVAQTFAPSIVRGATMPPSREAQTLYTAVAQTTDFSRNGKTTVATIHVLAHVPVERIRFELKPHFSSSFLRKVTVRATPDRRSDQESETETVAGEISHVAGSLRAGRNGSWSATDRRLAEPGDMAVDQSELSFGAVLETNLHSAATIQITIDDGDDAPLPLNAVRLEMRQREVCFDAHADAEPYTLLYGDAALHAPVYDYARLYTAATHALQTTLQPETTNPGYVPREDTRPYTERHPELLWVALLGVIGVLGSMALRSARRQKTRRVHRPPHRQSHRQSHRRAHLSDAACSRAGS